MFKFYGFEEDKPKGKSEILREWLIANYNHHEDYSEEALIDFVENLYLND